MTADGGSGGTGRAPRDLSALLGSRICHDLVSPLGAIGNGVELLEMTGLRSSPEIAMISESVENANARIRFFRIAFGAASAGQTVPLDEIRGILADMTRGSRIRFRWEPETGLDRPRIKLAFLILLCFEAVLPFGGEVTVRAEPGRWIAAATAERVTPAPDLWALLADPGAEVDITPAQVQFALVAGAARAAGRPVATAIEEAGISVAF